MAVNIEKEKPGDDGESRFQRLLALFSDDTSKLRLHEIKNFGGYSDDDVLWKVIYALELYQRMYESAPEAIKDAAESEIALIKSAAQSELELLKGQIAKDLAEAKLNLSESKAALNDMITNTYSILGETSRDAAGEISKMIIEEFRQGYRNQQAIDSMHTESINVIVTCWLPIVASIWLTDFFNQVKAFNIYTKAGENLYLKPISYIYDIPIGNVFAVWLACFVFLQFCRYSLKFAKWGINRWINKGIDKINARGGLF